MMLFTGCVPIALHEPLVPEYRMIGCTVVFNAATRLKLFKPELRATRLMQGAETPVPSADQERRIKAALDGILVPA